MWERLVCAINVPAARLKTTEYTKKDRLSSSELSLDVSTITPTSVFVQIQTAGL